MHQLTLTVDTRNSLVLSEASLMLQRLSQVSEQTSGTDLNITMGGTSTIEPFTTATIGFEPIAEPEGDTPPYTEGELDSAGMPWDERIHASTKSKVKDGTWTFRRGLDEATKQAVLAEYANAGLSVMPSNEPTATQPIAPITEQTPPPPPPVSAEQTPPPPPPPASEEEITTLPQFLKAVRAKGITPAQVQEACVMVGVANPISLGQDLEKLSEAAALLGL